MMDAEDASAAAAAAAAAADGDDEYDNGKTFSHTPTHKRKLTTMGHNRSLGLQGNRVSRHSCRLPGRAGIR